MRIKTTTAFAALNNRRANELRASRPFVVRALTKSGAVSKSQVNIQLDAFATADAAEARRVELERLNPTMKFAVVHEG